MNGLILNLEKKENKKKAKKVNKIGMRIINLITNFQKNITKSNNKNYLNKKKETYKLDHNKYNLKMNKNLIKNIIIEIIIIIIIKKIKVIEEDLKVNNIIQESNNKLKEELFQELMEILMLVGDKQSDLQEFHKKNLEDIKLIKFLKNKH